MALCECKCGGYANPGRRFIRGHNNRGKKVSEETIQKQKETKRINKEIRKNKRSALELPFCGCGCGGRVAKLGNKYIVGHNTRGKPSPMKGKIPWNKDLTKETNNILKIVSEKVSKTRIEKFASGELKIWNLGETKDTNEYVRMNAESTSKGMKKFYQTDEGKKLAEERSKNMKEFFATEEGQEWLNNNLRDENNPMYGKESWKRGLTKETNDSIRRGGEKLSITKKKFFASEEGKKFAKELGRTRKAFFATDEGQKWLDDNWRGENHPSYGNKRGAEKVSKGLKLFFATEDGKLLIKNRNLKLQKIMREKWQDPEFIKMMIESQGRKPNQPEEGIDSIVQLLIPNEYKYNGNYELGISIGGKIPDFVNVNGKKKAIDLFGDYWHEGENPQIRIDLFKKCGWDLLVIWEHELKNKDAVIQKIVKFHGIESDYVVPQKTLDKWVDSEKKEGER